MCSSLKDVDQVGRREKKCAGGAGPSGKIQEKSRKARLQGGGESGEREIKGTRDERARLLAEAQGGSLGKVN